jgi:hypothetical protein
MSKRAHPFDHSAVEQIGGSGVSRYAQELSAYAAKQRKPHGNAKPDVVRPTPERLAKADFEDILVPVKDADTKANARMSRVQTVFDRHKEMLPAHLREALQSVEDDFNKAFTSPNGLVASYGDGGSRAPGPRHGGIPDHVRENFLRIISLRSAIGDEQFQDFLVYVVEQANQARHQALQLPWRGRDVLKGLFWGWDASKIDSLAKAVHGWQVRERALGGRQQSTHTEISARIQAKREREWRRE